MSEDGGFWSSLAGIATRIADLAHNFTWSSLNETIKAIWGADESKAVLRWYTAEDERVCPICDANAGMTYTPDDPLTPDLPEHVDCRCWLEIVGYEDA